MTMARITRRQFGGGAAIAALLALGGGSAARAAGRHVVTHSEAEWRRLLTDDQFAVLRQAGTETPFTSRLLHEKRLGRFACAGCDNPVFASRTKFDSGTGWPSFWQALPGSVEEEADASLGMRRTAVACARCGGHLGHVFDDGPKPTGLRYCMNGVALAFHPSATA